MFDTEIFQAAILGIVQGLTEFLPISSSAHLILIPELFGWTGVVDSLSFDVALHLGSSVAVVFFFWKDWWRLISAFLKNITGGYKKVVQDQDSKLLLLILLGTIPAGVVGLLFEDYFTEAVRNPTLIALVLIIFAVVLYLADKVGNKSRNLAKVGFVDGLLIGLSQAVALIPGVSRSGVTISTGLFRNLDRETATRFSFLLSTPIIVAASIFSFKEILQSASKGDQAIFLVGFTTSVVSGFLAIKFLLTFVKSNDFTVFIIYRILLGLGIILLLFS
jgi:undecaprenyl-diphosphatase